MTFKKRAERQPLRAGLVGDTHRSITTTAVSCDWVKYATGVKSGVFYSCGQLLPRTRRQHFTFLRREALQHLPRFCCEVLDPVLDGGCRVRALNLGHYPGGSGRVDIQPRAQDGC